MNVKTILRDQQGEFQHIIHKDNYIEREFSKNHEIYEKSTLIKTIVGVRRSGKSTFTASMLSGKNVGYVNFDERVLLNADPDDILSMLVELNGGFKIIFLDEIQNVDRWELFVNKLHRNGYNVFLTGSSSRLLSKELSTHLTGRHIPLEIFPFSFREHLISKKINRNPETTRDENLIKHELDNYKNNGGFPEVVSGESPRPYLKSLYDDLVEKDIISRFNISYKSTFREIAMTMIGNAGKYVSYNKIKNDFGLKSDHTAKNYLSYLEESYLILQLKKFSFKPKEIEKSVKKTYCIDTGMINHASSRSTENIGNMMENIVYIDLLRRRSYFMGNLEIYYFKDYNDHEVDFVLKSGIDVKELINVTYSESKDDIEKREIKSLISASVLLHCTKLILITWNYEDIFSYEGTAIKAIPLWKWLLQA
ncbi:MAG: ATP-binding protein [Cuniculiplasma sp.]